MPDSEKKKLWMKKNFLTLGLKLHRKYDADIIEFLESHNDAKQKYLKTAMREYINNHS